MATLWLARRVNRTTKGIPGSLYVRDGKKRVDICKSIEREFLDNKRSISSIPVGRYRLTRRTNGRYYTIYSQRWGHQCVFEVADVPKRTAILLHAGRGTVDSKGCIITSHSHKIGKDGKLTANGTSRDAYCDLYNAIIAHNITHITIFDTKEAK